MLNTYKVRQITAELGRKMDIKMYACTIDVLAILCYGVRADYSEK